MLGVLLHISISTRIMFFSAVEKKILGVLDDFRLNVNMSVTLLQQLLSENLHGNQEDAQILKLLPVEDLEFKLLDSGSKNASVDSPEQYRS